MIKRRDVQDEQCLVSEYRGKLYSKFQKAQDEYLQRRRDNGHDKVTAQRLKQFLNSRSTARELDTVYPAAPEFTEARQYHKLGKVTKQVVTRYFVIEEDLMTYYENEDSVKPKKKVSLTDAVAVIEQYQEKSLVAIWTNTKVKSRTTIILNGGKKVHYYSEDLHELKALVFRVAIASRKILKEGLQQLLPKVSIVYSITKFDACWRVIQQVYSQRVARRVQLQNMGSNLVAVAEMAQLRNKRLLLLARTSVQNNKTEMRADLKRGLVSTFRTGRAKPNRKLSVFFSGQVINQQVEQLRHFFSTRRSRRTIETQQELDRLSEQHSFGYWSSCVLQKFNIKGEQIISQVIENARIFFQRHSPGNLLIEDQTKAKMTDPDFFALQFMNEICLSQVSMMAIDLIQEQNQEYTILICGPFLPQAFTQVPQENILSELRGYSPAVRTPYDQYSINIKRVYLPALFSSQYNRKGFVRVKLIQLRAESNSDQRQFSLSHDFRLNFTDEQIASGKPYIKTSFSFTVQKLLDSERECFKLEVIFVYNPTPMSLVVQEYIDRGHFSQKWDIGIEIQYSEGQDFVYKLKSEKVKGEFQVVFDVQHFEKSVKAMDYREGPRLLVGRYCLLDDQHQMQVVQLNRDDTLLLRSVHTHQLIENKIPLARVKFIERYGVSVYDLMRMPDDLKTAKFSWKCQITTGNKRLLNVIQHEIQKAQISEIFKRKQTQVFVVSGKLLCSILNVKGFANAMKPFVQVQIVQKLAGRDLVEHGPQVTDVVDSEENIDDEAAPNTEVSWVNSRHPLGHIFDLGHVKKTIKPTSPFEQTQVRCILVEVRNQSALLGHCEILTSSLVDLQDQAQDLCMLLKKDGKQCGMLQMQTRFIPDITTRQNFHITETSHFLEAPEAYLHYQSLIQTHLIDDHQYLVPLGDYNTRDHQSNVYFKGIHYHFRPLILKNEDQLAKTVKQIMFQKAFSAGRTGIDAKIFLKQCLQQKVVTNDAIARKVFMSQEEIRDIQMWNKNQSRPMRGPYCFNLQNLQKAKKHQHLVRFNEEQSLLLWNKFLDGLIHNNETLSAKDIEDIEGTLITPTQMRKASSGEVGVVYNKDLTKLVFCGSWEVKGDRNFADMFWLVHKKGVPISLRSRIWREMLKVSVNEADEIQHFIATFSSEQRYNPGWTIFTNYKVLSDRLDCLAFRQVDEDIGNYKFKSEYLAVKGQKREAQIFWERVAMREILRVLVLWSKDRSLDGKDISISYNSGTLTIIKRLLSVCKGQAEEVFWIFTGLVRVFPQCFAVSESVLKGSVNSVFRYEFTTLKALVEHNLPRVFQKLKDFGLPLEFLVYKSIISFYADFFSSELVLRLWDLIIFKFSTSQKKERKRGLWYILAPAFLILRDKQETIVTAESCEQIIQAYQSARTFFNNPDTFAQELDNTCDHLFVEQSQVPKRPIIAKLVYGVSFEILNKNAYDFEEQRCKYQQGVKQMFKSVSSENESVSQLIMRPGKILTYKQIREELMENLRAVCITKDSIIQRVHVYLHTLTNLPINQLSYCIKISYGYVHPETFLSSDASREVQSNRDTLNETIFDSTNVNSYHVFKYRSEASHLLIEVYEVKDEGKRIAQSLFRLQELPYNRFVSRTILMLTSALENSQTIPHLRSCFFIEASSNISNELHQIASSVRKKEPEHIDIFNRASQTDLSMSFARHVEGDYLMLNRFLDFKKSLEIINESYNYVRLDNYGKINLEDFLQLTTKLMPRGFHDENLLTQIFRTFAQDNDSTAVAKRLSKLQIGGLDQGRKSLTSIGVKHSNTPSLRSFLVTTILGSQSTVNQKFDALFDLFDWVDGSSDNIKPDVAFQLVSSVLQRCLYFMPHNELRNVIEFIFTGSVSMVLKAYWTQSLSHIRHIAQQESIPSDVIEITKEVQHALNNYFSVYGNKVIDFNFDTSAFAQLDLLVGKDAKRLLQMGSEYHLFLVCITDGERFTFEIDYDSQGRLIGVKNTKQRSEEDVKDISTYFDRISGRLNLIGLSAPITKQVFLDKIEQIPFLVNLVRVETFNVDRRFGKFIAKKPIDAPILVSCHAQGVQITFRFVSKYAQNILEGARFKLNSPGNYSVDMMSVNGEDTLAQLRVRVIESIQVMIKKNPDILPKDIVEEITGGRSWQCFGTEWDFVEDTERIENLKLIQEVVWLKLESSQNQCSSGIYDCLGLYRHSDMSYEWRPCRITRQELQANLQNFEKSSSYDAASFNYWIEFWHCRDQGSHMWFKRNFEEVLLSADYTRNQLRNFKQECLAFCKKLYE